MSNEYQRILRMLDTLESSERPQLVQMYVERRAQRKGLEDEKKVILKRLGPIERELRVARKEEQRLSKIVLGMDTVTKT